MIDFLSIEEIPVMEVCLCCDARQCRFGFLSVDEKIVVWHKRGRGFREGPKINIWRINFVTEHLQFRDKFSQSIQHKITRSSLPKKCTDIDCDYDPKIKELFKLYHREISKNQNLFNLSDRRSSLQSGSNSWKDREDSRWSSDSSVSLIFRPCQNLLSTVCSYSSPISIVWLIPPVRELSWKAPDVGTEVRYQAWHPHQPTHINLQISKVRRNFKGLSVSEISLKIHLELLEYPVE